MHRSIYLPLTVSSKASGDAHKNTHKHTHLYKDTEGWLQAATQADYQSCEKIHILMPQTPAHMKKVTLAGQT